MQRTIAGYRLLLRGGTWMFLEGFPAMAFCLILCARKLATEKATKHTFP